MTYEAVEHRIMDFGMRAPWKGNLGSAIAPVGKVVETAGGVRGSTDNFDRPERIDDLDFLPPLEGAAQKPGGYIWKAVSEHQQLGGWIGRDLWQSSLHLRMM